MPLNGHLTKTKETDSLGISPSSIPKRTIMKIPFQNSGAIVTNVYLLGEKSEFWALSGNVESELVHTW